jgi:hypothetical protein
MITGMTELIALSVTWGRKPRLRSPHSFQKPKNLFGQKLVSGIALLDILNGPARFAAAKSGERYLLQCD